MSRRSDKMRLDSRMTLVRRLQQGFLHPPHCAYRRRAPAAKCGFVCQASCSWSYALGEKGCVEHGVTMFHVADRFASYVVSAALGSVVCKEDFAWKEGDGMSGSLVKSGCALIWGYILCGLRRVNILSFARMSSQLWDWGRFEWAHCITSTNKYVHCSGTKTA